MTIHDIREAYLAFFKERGHVVIPSASLRPENDPTTLFIGSGMQPLVPYLMGQKHPAGTRLVNAQRCFRAEDIEEVGDNRHTTFFEMLGNWSLGSYFKREQLPWIYTFLVDEVGLDPSRLYVTCFIGDDGAQVPRDTESAQIWQELFIKNGLSAQIAVMGSEAEASARGMRDGERIFYFDATKNWWSRAGAPEKMPVGEIGGADSEIFYDFGTEHDSAFGAHCHPNCDCGRFMEIGNSVFMEYVKEDASSFAQLPQQNVDFGGGLERIAAAANDNADIFALDVFAPLITALEEESAKSYADGAHTEAFRIIADHLRGSVFMIADGIMPSNKEQGYILRRLIRRATLYADRLGIAQLRLGHFARYVTESYAPVCEDVRERQTEITEVIANEEEKFRRALAKGLREFEKRVTAGDGKQVSGDDAFVLFTTYGFPYEVTKELAAERNMTVDRDGFEAAFDAHQKRSQGASAQKFAGGLAEHSAKTTAFHTATHLTLAALRKFLGPHVHQAGSNITQERMRFDFTHPEKVSRDVLDEVERFVNDAIVAKADVTTTEMEKEAAKECGVEGSFWEKYPEHVTVYTIAGADGTEYSRELCGGPHVQNTGDITQFGTFKITKEQSSSAGVRRIKAVFVQE